MTIRQEDKDFEIEAKLLLKLLDAEHKNTLLDKETIRHVAAYLHVLYDSAIGEWLIYN